MGDHQEKRNLFAFWWKKFTKATDKRIDEWSEGQKVTDPIALLQNNKNTSSTTAELSHAS